MNDSNKSSNGLLVLRYPCDLSQETANRLTEFLTPTAEALGVEPLVLGNGADVRLEYGSSALLERVCVALEKIAAQGEAPVLETQEGPSERATLNARDPMLYPANNGGKPEAPPVGDPLPGLAQPAPLPEGWGLNSRGEPLAYDGHD